MISYYDIPLWYCGWLRNRNHRNHQWISWSTSHESQSVSTIQNSFRPPPHPSRRPPSCGRFPGDQKKTLAYFSHGGFCGIFHNAIWLDQLCGFLIPKTSKNHDFLHHVPINIHEPYGMLGSIFKPAEDDKFMSDINNMYERSTCNLGQKPVMKLVLIKPMICVS